MPTPHENHSFWRREHIVTANRTVTLRRALYASMRVLDRNRQTDTARLAVEEILPQALSNTAYTTVIAMIYALVCVIVPELTNVAIVLRRRFTTMFA